MDRVTDASKNGWASMDDLLEESLSEETDEGQGIWLDGWVDSEVDR